MEVAGIGSVGRGIVEGGGVFHAGQDGAELLELGLTVKGLEAGVGEHLEEPGAAHVHGGLQLRQGVLDIAEGDVNGGVEGGGDEAFAAQPSESGDQGAGLRGAAGAGQRVCVDGGDLVVVGHAGGEGFGQAQSGRGVAVVGEDDGAVEGCTFVIGEGVEAAAHLGEAFRGSSGKVESPGAPRVEPGSERIEAEGGIEQGNAFVEAQAAEGEHDAGAGDGGVVGQVGGAGEGVKRGGKVVVDMKAERAEGGQRRVGVVVWNGVGGAAGDPTRNGGRHVAEGSLGHAEADHVDLGGDEGGVEIDGAG